MAIDSCPAIWDFKHRLNFRFDGKSKLVNVEPRA
jgi:hypothetical protein